MAIKKQLKNPPLVEAIFEIRYDPVENPKDVAARLGSVLNDYPDFEDLGVPELPKEIPEVSNIIRYRFRSADRSCLFQIGTGILSVNVLRYSNFSNFKKAIEAVLGEHKKIVGAPYVKRLGLRYVNKIKLINKAPGEILNFASSIPDGFPQSLGWNSQFLFASEGKQIKVITNHSVETQELLLDLDCFSSGLYPYNNDQLIAWADAAHEQIEGLFVKSLSKGYLEEIS